MTATQADKRNAADLLNGPWRDIPQSLTSAQAWTVTRGLVGKRDGAERMRTVEVAVLYASAMRRLIRPDGARRGVDKAAVREALIQEATDGRGPAGMARLRAIVERHGLTTETVTEEEGMTEAQARMFGRWVRSTDPATFSREARAIGSRALAAVGRSIAAQDPEQYARWMEEEEAE